jgi:hypothetical protein
MNSDQPGPYAQPEAPSPPGGDSSEGSGGGGSASGGFWSRGRTIGVIAGVTVIVAACAGGYFLLGPGARTSYRLTTPRTVAGEYTRDGKGIKGDGSAFGDKRVPGMSSEANVNAKYKSGMLKQLQLGGAYGSVDDPEKAVGWVLAKTRESLKLRTGASAKGEPRAFHPAGFDDGVLKCQEYRVATMGLAMCVWGDSSTVGTVSSFELSGGERTKPVNLKRTAELTAKVRRDALVAKG